MVKEYGYEYDAALNEAVWSQTEGKVTTDQLFGAYCLRSGRDALKAIAREYSPSVALLPALSCDSMVRPFEQYGHTVKYYKLNSDFSVDLNNLNIGEEQTLFLYMDYFGKSSIKDADLNKLRDHDNIAFIEDRTHNLIWHRNNAFQPDYIMASLRKWLPIPDGGLLWGKVTKPFASDTAFSTTRLKAQCMRREYFSCGDENIKKEYRKIFSTVSNIMDNDEPSYMSAYTYELVSNTDWDKIRSTRKDNAEVLISILSTSPYVTIIQGTAGKSDLYVPFTVANRGEVQRRLSAEGIFNTVIWPLVDEQKCVCSVAEFTEANMLAAPCDQRYTVDDMEYIGKEIVRVIDDANK